MAGCFDFRTRTSSFDLHQLAQRRRLTKISKLFRSQSFNSVKDPSPKTSPKTSPKSSPKGSPTGTVVRRRFLRVVKDAEAHGEEYDNPHLIRHYTQQYVKDQWSQRSSGSFEDQVLPYTVSGHTILKKPSLDSPTGSADLSPVQSKHASFKEEVQIIEFDKKGKIGKCHCFRRMEKLQDSGDEFYTEICHVCQSKGRDDCPHLSSDSDLSDADDTERFNGVLSTLREVSLNEEQKKSDSESVNRAEEKQESSPSEAVVFHKDPSPDSIVDKLVFNHTEFASSEKSVVHTP